MNTIKEHRTAQGLTLRQLAQRSGMSHARISEFERGIKHQITLSRARGLADALGVGLDVLFPTPDARGTLSRHE